MAVTKEEVKAKLDPDEVDYELAAELGPEAIPWLKELAQESDSLLASKAVFLASLIEGVGRKEVLEIGAHDEHAEVRVATAAGLEHVPESIARDLYSKLLDDGVLGVRKIALYSVQEGKASYMKQKVAQMTVEDPAPFIRNLAEKVLASLPQDIPEQSPR